MTQAGGEVVENDLRLEIARGARALEVRGWRREWEVSLGCGSGGLQTGRRSIGPENVGRLS